jgi:ABC-type thiamine transport system ATPase subunit
MRITRVEVSGWRNIESLLLDVPPEASLVCVVGANGTGKSNLLELISAAATKFGLAHGVEMARGNPLQGTHSFAIETVLGEDPTEFFGLPPDNQSSLPTWSGRLRYERADGGDDMRALDLPLDEAAGIFQQVGRIYKQREEIAHLYLDADRSYPSSPVHVNEFAQMLEQPFDDPAWQRQWTYRPSKTLYSEWIKFMLATEQRAATEYTQAARQAALAGGDSPGAFIDPFSSYSSAVNSVLPHLRFRGVDTRKRTVLFEVDGVSLTFDDLSGGEREIAFLLGQIERFKLRRGLLLIDEPELHLNPDLLRRWLSYLRGTVQSGQVWIATHSLEAAEVAGGEATFVLHRDPATRRTARAEAVADSPALALLSASVGSPAFSLHDAQFVLIEGDRQNRERARFHEVCGNQDSHRFLESGGCEEVLRRLRVLKDLALDIAYPFATGAVIDRDFRNEEECVALIQNDVHVLGVHEVENIFLDPTALAAVAVRNGVTTDSLTLVRDTSDQFAGTWCLQSALAAMGRRDSTREMRIAANEMPWVSLAADPRRRLTELAAGDSELFIHLETALNRFGEIRESDALWMHCLGKECLRSIPRLVGLTGPTFLEQSVVHCWAVEGVPMPDAAVQLRGFIAGLSATT